jgi:acyl-CoA thioesterase
MSRQQTPDIMANLMSGASGHIASEQVNHKEIKQVEGKTSKQAHDFTSESNKTIKLPKNKTIEQDGHIEINTMKEKATFNLSLSSLEALEDAWIKLKRQFKGEQRITKTAIVEAALELCIAELEEQGNESSLFKRLADFRSKINLNDNSPS